MNIQTKTVFVLYAVFAFMGLWFGYAGFDFESNHFNSSGYFYVVLIFFILTLIGAVVQMIVVMVLSEDNKDPSELYENAGVRIQIGFSLMSMAMAYGFNAGPLHEDGSVMSPWLLFPMLASLPIIHMMTKEAATATGEVVPFR